MNQELLVKLAAIGLQHLQQEEEMRKEAAVEQDVLRKYAANGMLQFINGMKGKGGHTLKQLISKSGPGVESGILTALRRDAVNQYSRLMGRGAPVKATDMAFTHVRRAVNAIEKNLGRPDKYRILAQTEPHLAAMKRLKVLGGDIKQMHSVNEMLSGVTEKNITAAQRDIIRRAVGPGRQYSAYYPPARF